MTPDERAPSSDISPAASVIVPAHGRDRVLACLESLREQTSPPTDYEVIVIVLADSTPAADHPLQSFAPPYALTVGTSNSTSVGAARNAGAEKARGRILIFLDDAAVAGPELVAAHLNAHRHSENVAVIGQLTRVVAQNADRFTRFEAEIWERRHRRRQSGVPSFADFHSGNCSLPARLFSDVGGYASDLPALEDFELAYRLREAGARFVCAPAAAVLEQQAEAGSRIAEDERLRGRTTAELYRRHPPLLAHTALGGIDAPGPRKKLVQALLLRLRVSPRLLVRAGAIVPGEGRARQIHGFVREYSFWGGVREAVDSDFWRRIRSPTMILLYHALARPGERRARFVVSAASFARQMRWLKRWRYNVISLERYLDLRGEHRLPPPRSVVITFDDGYADNAEVGMPILERFGFNATIFVVTAARQADWTRDLTLGGRPLIPLSELRRLTAVFDFGAHTRTHVQLDDVEPGVAREEIVESKRELEHALGRAIPTFAYPYGAYDDATRTTVQEAGFAGACSVRAGGNFSCTDPFQLRRLEIRGGYSLLRFGSSLLRGDTTRLLSRLRTRLSVKPSRRAAPR